MGIYSSMDVLRAYEDMYEQPKRKSKRKSRCKKSRTEYYEELASEDTVSSPMLTIKNTCFVLQAAKHLYYIDHNKRGNVVSGDRFSPLFDHPELRLPTLNEVLLFSDFYKQGASEEFEYVLEFPPNLMLLTSEIIPENGKYVSVLVSLDGSEAHASNNMEAFAIPVVKLRNS